MVEDVPIIAPSEIPSTIVENGTFSFDIVRPTLEMLSRSEEIGATDFEAGQSLLTTLNLQTVPVVNCCARRLHEEIKRSLDKTAGDCDRITLWDEAEFAVVLFNDVDHVYHRRSVGALQYLGAALTGEYSLCPG